MIALWDWLRSLDPRIYWIAVIASTVHFLIRFALNMPGARTKIAQIFVGDRSVLQLYRRLVDTFVNFTKGLLYSQDGERRRFLEGYGFFIAIAWSYTVVFFLIGWVTGGSGKVGPVRIIAPDQYAHVARIGIALGFAVLGYLVWRTVKSREILHTDPGYSMGQRLGLAALASAMVFGALWWGQDRAFGLSDEAKLVMQGIMAAIAFVAIYRSGLLDIGVLFAATASYGYAVGIPILIAVPLTVAVASILGGTWPIWFSTVVIPLAMYVYYLTVPLEPVLSHTHALILGTLGFLPVGAAVLATEVNFRRGNTPRARRFGVALLYALLVLVVLAFSAYSSTNQVRDDLVFAAVVFWLFMPLLNALFDYTSWSVTWFLMRSLTEYLAKADVVPVRRSYLLQLLIEGGALLARGVVAFLHIGGNVIATVLVLIAIYFCIPFAIESINVMMRSVRPEYWLDSAEVVGVALAQPYKGDGLWVAAVLYSTLVPSMLHLLLVMVALFATAFQPGIVRESWETLKTPEAPADEVLRAITVSSRYVTVAVTAGLVVMAFLGEVVLRYGYYLPQFLNSVGEKAVALSRMLLSN